MVAVLMFPRLQARGGVAVSHHTDISSRPLSEFVAAAALHFAKDLPALASNAAGRRWERPPRGLAPRQLSGMTVGVVGCGSIGRAIASTMKHGFGMRVVGLTRTARGYGNLEHHCWTGSRPFLSSTPSPARAVGHALLGAHADRGAGLVSFGAWNPML